MQVDFLLGWRYSPVVMKARHVLLLLVATLTADATVVCAAAEKPRRAYRPGTRVMSVDIRLQGLRRTYLLHVPRGYDPARPWPLVVAVHGAFSKASAMERETGWSDLADREGFIVAYPNGFGLFGLIQHWNAGHCCGRAADKKIDDVGFLSRVIDDVAKRMNVDPQRIYMTGFSNGGMLVYRFGAERPSEVAAIGVVSGTIASRVGEQSASWRIPDPGRPLPVVVFHGLADTKVPFGGGTTPRGNTTWTVAPVAEAVGFWVTNNGCRAEADREALWGGAVTRETRGGGRAGADVVLYSIEGWDHYWPGPYWAGRRPEGGSLGGFDAAEIVWQFFRRHERGP